MFRIVLEAKFGAMPDWAIAKLDSLTEEELLQLGMRLIVDTGTLEELLGPPATEQSNAAPTALEVSEAP